MQEIQKIKEWVAIIGAGNMAEALVSGLVRNEVCLPDHLCVTDVREERRTFFRTTFHVRDRSDNIEAVRESDIIVLAIKPQYINDVLHEIAPVITEKHRILSIAAGVTTKVIEALLPSGTRVIRAMPNTPALVGMGVAGLCPGAHAKEEDLVLAEHLLAATGKVVRVAEADMDAVTAVSGSGPAYVFFLMEAMQAAAEQLGLSADIARTLIVSTVEGAARLALETGDTPGELRARVTSKGGTTATALNVMYKQNTDNAIQDAVKAAHARARELSGGGA